MQFQKGGWWNSEADNLRIPIHFLKKHSKNYALNTSTQWYWKTAFSIYTWYHNYKTCTYQWVPWYYFNWKMFCLLHFSWLIPNPYISILEEEGKHNNYSWIKVILRSSCLFIITKKKISHKKWIWPKWRISIYLKAPRRWQREDHTLIISIVTRQTEYKK